MEIFGFNIPLWLILIILMLYVYYRYMTYTYNVFKKLGVPGPTPKLATGTMGILLEKGLREHDSYIKQTYGNVVGIFQGRVPLMMIYDPDILKAIMIKDFNNFTNRMVYTTSNDPIIDNIVSFQKDDVWRNTRSILAPTFSGNKLRKLACYVNDCSHLLLENLQVIAKSGDSFDSKEFCGSFTMDMIASVAFGLKINSQTDKDDPFVKTVKKAFYFNFSSPKLIFSMVFPFLAPKMYKLGLPFFPQECTEFFKRVINDAIKLRKENGNRLQDFLQILIDAHLEPSENGTTERKGLTTDEVLAQALTFFLAGHDTTASALSFTMYNLATNQDVQDKLYDEIISVMKDQFQNDPDYDIVKKMTYMDMCIDETLRLYPTAPRMDRVANEDITIQGVLIPKGMTVVIPISTIHRDPEAWSDPDKFDPDRFLPGASDSRSLLHFMPFGAGPRSCVAMRLGQLVLKLALVHILRKYKVKTCEKTQIPLKLQKFKSDGENGIHLCVELRQ